MLHFLLAGARWDVGITVGMTRSRFPQPLEAGCPRCVQGGISTLLALGDLAACEPPLASFSSSPGFCKTRLVVTLSGALWWARVPQGCPTPGFRAHMVWGPHLPGRVSVLGGGQVLKLQAIAGGRRKPQPGDTGMDSAPILGCS